VDASNSEMLSSDQVVRRPQILKILFRGTELDLEIVERLTEHRFQSLGEYWKATFGAHRGQPRLAGNGYQKLRKSSRVRKRGDGKPGVSASYLWDLPELTSEAMSTTLIHPSELRPFRLERIHDPRPRDIFLGPKLLVHKSPPAREGRIRVAVTDVDAVFNET
jgi:hypothetical protein